MPNKSKNCLLMVWKHYLALSKCLHTTFLFAPSLKTTKSKSTKSKTVKYRMHSPVNKFLLKVNNSDTNAMPINIVLVSLLKISNRYLSTGECRASILPVECWVYNITVEKILEKRGIKVEKKWQGCHQIREIRET